MERTGGPRTVGAISPAPTATRAPSVVVIAPSQAGAPPDSASSASGDFVGHGDFELSWSGACRKPGVGVGG